MSVLAKSGFNKNSSKSAYAELLWRISFVLISVVISPHVHLSAVSVFHSRAATFGV